MIDQNMQITWVPGFKSTKSTSDLISESSTLKRLQQWLSQWKVRFSLIFIDFSFFLFQQKLFFHIKMNDTSKPIQMSKKQRSDSLIDNLF